MSDGTTSSGEERSVTLRWTGGQRFEGRNAAGAETSVDGGGESGASPVELLLEAVAACSGIDVVEILRKGRQEVEGLEVEAAGTRREEPPRRYTSLRFLFRVSGDVDPEKAERAVSLSLETYCSVFHSLDPALREATDVRVVVAS